MLKDHYDTIIIGAGPSGLSCALNLLREGRRDILVLERFSFPRDKCCAGYITGKTKKEYEQLGLGIESCHYNLIEDFRIMYKGGFRQRIINKFLYTNRNINRVELDNAFCLLAKGKGIRVVENVRAAAFDAEEKTVATADGDVIHFDHLVLADGTVGLGCDARDLESRNIAMQLLFESGLPDGIEIHFGFTKRGYGWVSTMGGVTNIGLTDEYDGDLNYHEIFADYVASLGLSPDLSGLYGAFTPIGVREPVKDGCVYYVGDALGACDPLTLSGLRYGLASGREAAHAIASGNDESYTRFADDLRRRFSAMRSLMKVFYTKPVQFLVFNVGCRLFGPLISLVFNNFFVNKK